MNTKSPKKSQAKKASSADFQTALNARNCVTYRLRTECLLDADLIRALLNPWLLGWSQQATSLNDAGEIAWPDVDVEMQLKTTAPTLPILRSLISLLPDCHVAAESLNHAKLYTGERIDPDLVDRIELPEAFLATVRTDLAWIVKRLSKERTYLKRFAEELR